MRLPPDEIERRRQASIKALRRKEQEEFDRWYQEKCDQMYWAHGPCCAGCDHWKSDAGMSGACTAAPIMSGEDVLRSMGITWSSYIPAPGNPYTKADQKCGLFKDDFDWSTLPPEYLTRIGAPKHFTADQEGELNGRDIMIASLKRQIERMKPRPLEWEQPCKANNYCLLARTGYGTYYIHMDGGFRQAWLDDGSGLETYLGDGSGSTFTEQMKCQDEHVRRVTAELIGHPFTADQGNPNG